jgi:hypothetical protein
MDGRLLYHAQSKKVLVNDDISENKVLANNDISENTSVGQ